MDRTTLIAAPLVMLALAASLLLWVKYGGQVYADALLTGFAGCF